MRKNLYTALWFAFANHDLRLRDAMDQLLPKALAGAALTAALAFGLATVSIAAGIQPPQRSGNVFSVAACDEQVQPMTARCHARIITDESGRIFARNAQPNFTPAGYGAGDLRTAYSISTNGSSATTVAIVDAFGYPNAEADLGVYRAQYGLPVCTTGNGCFKKVNQNGVQGSYPRTNGGWAQETALDLDMASAMCPNCKILLVEATTNGFADLATAVNRAASMGAHVISNSYGGGEAGSTPYESAYNHPGVAVTVSSGDSGFGVQFPASSPHVIAVGGTHLIISPRSETAWSGAGSGCSTIYAKPAWQHDPLCTKRMEADVSAVADPATFVAVYGPVAQSRGSLISGWTGFGGTSVAAPLIGGIYGVNGGAVNYGADPYSHTANLHDVTSGSNGSCGGTYFCTAVPGYDGPTGLGTPNGPSAF